MKRKAHLPISIIMQGIINDINLSENLTIYELISLFRYRSFGIIILIFAIFCVLPFSIIPGVAVILAVPITLMGLQLGFGKKSPWLPKKLIRLRIEKAKVKRIFVKIMPFVKLVEKFLKPRWFLFSTKFFEHIIGWVFVLLGLMLMSPLPFSNMLFGLLTLLLAIGLIEQDGIILLFAVVATIAIAIGLIVSIKVLLG